MLKVLVIEDDGELRELLGRTLRHAGYQVEEAGDGLAGLECHQARPADLILLDLMLPGLDGFGILKALRPRDEVPVIMLTAMGQERTRIQGFDLGADDYLVKPFSVLELLARIRAISKRVHRFREPAPLLSGPFTIDLTKRRILRDGAALPVSPSEFNVLEALVHHPGRPITRTEVLKLAWPASSRPSPRTVDVHVVNLRKKLTQAGDPAWIMTTGSLGYCWTEPVQGPGPG